MINIKLKGKALYNNRYWNWNAISEDGNLLILIYLSENNLEKCQIQIKKEGDYYEEIEHNLPLQSYLYIFSEKIASTYIIQAVRSSEKLNTIYRIDINTRLIAQIYQSKEESYFFVERNLIYDLNYNGDLKITSIDHLTIVKETIFKCVKALNFVQYKGEHLLEIQYLNQEIQYYRETELDRVFQYNGRKRLSLINTTLFLQQPNAWKNDEYLTRVRQKIDSNNICQYEFSDNPLYCRWIDYTLSKSFDGTFLQIRPKSKIVRKFKRTGVSHITSMPNLAIHTIEIGELYQHFIIDITTAQTQQIPSHYQIDIIGDRLLEYGKDEVWIYDLELIQ